MRITLVLCLLSSVTVLTHKFRSLIVVRSKLRHTRKSLRTCSNKLWNKFTWSTSLDAAWHPLRSIWMSVHPAEKSLAWGAWCSRWKMRSSRDASVYCRRRQGEQRTLWCCCLCYKIERRFNLTLQSGLWRFPWKIFFIHISLQIWHLTLVLVCDAFLWWLNNEKINRVL